MLELLDQYMVRGHAFRRRHKMTASHQRMAQRSARNENHIFAESFCGGMNRRACPQALRMIRHQHHRDANYGHLGLGIKMGEWYESTVVPFIVR